MRALTFVLRTFVAALLALVPLASSEGLPDLSGAWVEGRSEAIACCLRPDDPFVTTPEQACLASTYASLRRDRLIAAPLLDEAARLGVGVCLDAYPRGCDGSFVCADGVILLNAAIDDGLRTAILVHELRHMDRAAAGFVIDLRYDVEAARTLLCASEADAQAVATWFAWRLAALGDARPWRALVAHPHYGDIALAFEAAMTLGADEATAARVAFARWYASDWRLSTYRFGAALSYLAMLDDEHAVIGYEALPADFFIGFDVLPDGSSYGARPRTVE